MQARRAEVACKVERVRRMMARSELDGVLLTTHYNFSWITAGGRNYVASCFDAGATAILITQERCVALCSIIEAPRIREEEQLEELGFELRVFGWQQDRTAALAEEYVRPERTAADASIGPIACRNDLIAPLRRELTEGEAARYRRLGDVMSEGLERCLLDVRPGMTELEIAGSISRALWERGIEQVMHLVTADERCFKFRHGLPTDRRLEKLLIVSVNGRCRGLITTVSRMVCIGRVPEEIQARYQACLEIEGGAMRSMKPGAPVRDAFHALRAGYGAAGWPDMFDRHGQGGCQGYLPREYMFTAACSERVQIGCAYCFNPVIDGAKSEDAFLVTRDGLEMITHPVVFGGVEQRIGAQTVLRPAIAQV